MKKLLLFALVAIAAIAGCTYFFKDQSQQDIPVPVPTASHKVVLLPLDSRPPCTKLVADNGHTAGIEVVMPPSQYMDYYTQPGDISALRLWLATEIKQADEAIISIDQLLYGGLIASRNKSITDNDIAELIAYLQQLHADNPQVKLYAFAILPRMTPPDYIEVYEDRENLMEWSRLIHRYYDDPSEENYTNWQAAQQNIPLEHIQAYAEIYERNYRLNCQLAELMQSGVLHQLVLAQDDGEAFSLPNLKLNEFLNHLEEKGVSTDHLAVIHGADEVALSIFTNITKEKTGRAEHFKVFVDYNAPEMVDKIMPYMAISNQETVTERLAFNHSVQVDSVDEADYVLFISCGSQATMNERRKSIDRLSLYHDWGKPIALVDLSQKFSAQEALFPLMLKEDYPLNGLVAYAGWNTTSNSIGTAVGQAEIYLSSLQASGDKDNVVYFNLRNLNNRFLEDYYYLKDIIDVVNLSLKKKGYANVYDLDLNHNYRWSADMLRASLKQRLDQYNHSNAFRRSFYVAEADSTYAVTDINLEAFFPWPRTFEINLDTTLKVVKK